MTNDYHVEFAGNAFILIDDAGEQVNTYPTKDAAMQGRTSNAAKRKTRCGKQP
jgi:hypothetical protein